MRQNKIKWAYQKPQTEIVIVNNETLLAETSFPSQHNPGKRKSGPSANAKEAFGWANSYEETVVHNGGSSLWEE